MACNNDVPEEHPNADRRNLTRRQWWEAFVSEYQRLTGISADELDRADILTRYYSKDTTPLEAVLEDMENYGLEFIS